MRKASGSKTSLGSIVCAVVSVSICSAMTVGGVAQAKAKTSSEERVAIERLFVAWNSRDVDKVVAVFDSAAVYDDVAAGQVHHGRKEIRKWVTGAFRDIDNFKLEIVRSRFYKGGGVVERVWSGSDKGLFNTGRGFSIRGISVVDIRRGKVSYYKEYYDFGTLMRQLGLASTETEK